MTNVSLIIGMPSTGKTSLAEYVATLCGRQVLYLDDLDYDGVGSPSDMMIATTLQTSKHKLIIVDVIDNWPKKLVDHMYLHSKKEKMPFSVVILAEDSLNSNAKSLVKTVPAKHVFKLYTKAPNNNRNEDIFMSAMS